VKSYFSGYFFSTSSNNCRVENMMLQAGISGLRNGMETETAIADVAHRNIVQLRRPVSGLLARILSVIKEGATATPSHAE
jgi:hypothetical protein